MTEGQIKVKAVKLPRQPASQAKVNEWKLSRARNRLLFAKEELARAEARLRLREEELSEITAMIAQGEQ